MAGNFSHIVYIEGVMATVNLYTVKSNPFTYRLLTPGQKEMGIHEAIFGAFRGLNTGKFLRIISPVLKKNKNI